MVNSARGHRERTRNVASRPGGRRKGSEWRVRRRRSIRAPISRVPLLHGADFNSEARSDAMIVPAVPAKVCPFVAKVGVGDRIEGEGQPLVRTVNVVAVVVCHAS
ncbi:hypothetical protein NLX62_01455 [Mycobacteriaceae bacterium Msp059]|nr:hypothetical protein [Mycobacteriaceae bacterium Msp059]